MSTTVPAPHLSSPTEDDAPPQPPRWRRLLRHPWLRTAGGLLVLGAILGGLFAFNRLGGDDAVGPLDDRKPEVGELAPQFVLRAPDGNLHRLDDFRGQVVWVNFWATWCGPCRRELPAMQRLANEFQDQGLVILAVDFRESSSTAQDFWEELDLELPMLLDSDGAVAEQYRLFGFPGHFFLDRDGVVHSLEMGDLTEEEMRERLAELGLG